MRRIYLGLGSNMGSRVDILNAAVEMINKRIGNVVSLSAFYDTVPCGFQSENRFLNAACGVDSPLSPLEILDRTEAIERELGRTAKSRNREYHDRAIDIDILLIENMILQSERLTIPHPLMHNRDFVLAPLSEIAPQAVHPVLNKQIADLMRDL